MAQQPPYQPPYPPQPQWRQTPSQPLQEPSWQPVPQQYPQQGYGQPQWQQWQQQPQQPYYPPPMQQPTPPPAQPKKSHKGLFIVLGVLAAMLVLGCVGISALISAGGHAVQQAANQASTEIATSVATTKPTAQPKLTTNNVVGQTASSGEWQVTVNKVSSAASEGYFHPSAGNVFLFVSVTLKNTSSSAQTASSLIMFTLKDATNGQKYQQDIGTRATPDGSVAPGSLLRGDLTYEVPKNAHSFTLQFTPDFNVANLVEWTIKD